MGAGVRSLDSTLGDGTVSYSVPGGVSLVRCSGARQQMSGAFEEGFLNVWEPGFMVDIHSFAFTVATSSILRSVKRN